MDLIIALDELTEKQHKKNLRKGGKILKGHKENMYYAGRMFKLLDIKFSILDEILRGLKKRYDENIKHAAKGYEDEKFCSFDGDSGFGSNAGHGGEFGCPCRWQ